MLGIITTKNTMVSLKYGKSIYHSYSALQTSPRISPLFLFSNLYKLLLIGI